MKKKFIDGLSTAVFTTKFILEKSETIKYVYHYEEDGAWEFVGVKDLNESDYKVVSLDEIIKIDQSILDISDLPLGYYAYRNTQESAWIIEKII